MADPIMKRIRNVLRTPRRRTRSHNFRLQISNCSVCNTTTDTVMLAGVGFFYFAMCADCLREMATHVDEWGQENDAQNCSSISSER